MVTRLLSAVAVAAFDTFTITVAFDFTFTFIFTFFITFIILSRLHDQNCACWSSTTPQCPPWSHCRNASTLQAPPFCALPLFGAWGHRCFAPLLQVYLSWPLQQLHRARRHQIGELCLVALLHSLTLINKSKIRSDSCHWWILHSTRQCDHISVSDLFLAGWSPNQTILISLRRYVDT